MYEHFEPSTRIFVDREEYLEWMDDALTMCKERSVVLHLHGIGGIGKSSLLDYWSRTIESTIRLDCEQNTEFYDRLNTIAKGANLIGIKLPRFDVLWQIRQRFIEGVEPSREKGREVAREIIMQIPFIGMMASIGSALSTVGEKVTPKLKSRHRDVGNWLEKHLGKKYIEKLLEILWQDPRHAEFLYLDALLEDLNNRKSVEVPILLMLDHFEFVDDEKARWRYSDKQITETQLWQVFLSSLTNCVGIMAGRRELSKLIDLEIEDLELTELDRASCIELLEERGIDEKQLQEIIVSVSGGNPFVIDTICDIIELKKLTNEEIENLRASSLEEVRIKTWKRLFSEAKDLSHFIDRIGLLPYLNRELVEIVLPEMKSHHWNRLIQLSFIRKVDDETWVMHELARELIVSELGQQLNNVVDQISVLLENEFESKSDYAYLGFALSVRAQASESEAVDKLYETIGDLMWQGALTNALTLLEEIRITTIVGQACRQLSNGWILLLSNRTADAEYAFKEVIEFSKPQGDGTSDELLFWVAAAYDGLGNLYHGLNRYHDAETASSEAIRIMNKIDEITTGYRVIHFAMLHKNLGDILLDMKRIKEAEAAYLESLQIHERLTQSFQDLSPFEQRQHFRNLEVTLTTLGDVALQLGDVTQAEEFIQRALEIEGEPTTRWYSLRSLGVLLRSVNRTSEAEVVLNELVEVTRGIVKRDNQMKAILISPLISLGILFTKARKISNAKKQFEEALEILDELSETSSNPNAVALVNSYIGIVFRKLRKWSEAEIAYIQSLEWFRNSASIDPDRSSNEVARVLNSLAIVYRFNDKPLESKSTYQEALDIAERVSSKNPDIVFFSDLYAVILNNIGILLRQMGNHEKARESYQNALDIWKRLAEISSGLFLHHYFVGLNNLGVLMCETGNQSEAEGIFNECLDTRRILKDNSEDVFLPCIVSTLNNLGILFMRDNRIEEAERTFREAIGIQEKMFAKEPEVNQYSLGGIISNLIILLTEEGNAGEAETLAKRLKDMGATEPAQEVYWSEEEIEIFNPHF